MRRQDHRNEVSCSSWESKGFSAARSKSLAKTKAQATPRRPDLSFDSAQAAPNTGKTLIMAKVGDTGNSCLYNPLHPNTPMTAQLVLLKMRKLADRIPTDRQHPKLLNQSTGIKELFFVASRCHPTKNWATQSSSNNHGSPHVEVVFNSQSSAIQFMDFRSGRFQEEDASWVGRLRAKATQATSSSLELARQLEG